MNAATIHAGLSAEWDISPELCEQIAGYPEIRDAADIDAAEWMGDIIVSVNGSEVLRVDLDANTVERV